MSQNLVGTPPAGPVQTEKWEMTMNRFGSRVSRCCLVAVAVLLVVDTSAQSCNTSVPESTPTVSFSLASDGTATDLNTGLMWKRCAEGQVWSGGACTGTAATFNWQGALQQGAGSSFAAHADWRLPNVRELKSIVEEGCYYPSINTTVFPAVAPNSYFWSSSGVADDYNSTSAWTVGFNVGWTFQDSKSSASSVRLVRTGQPLAGSRNFQGLWWNAPAGSESGWGINFAHQGDIVFATWFTYDAARQPWWLIALLNKTAGGVYSGPVSTVTGPPFNTVPFTPGGSPGGAIEAEVGTATATFADGNSATLAYTVNGTTQTKAITRQVFVAPGTVCQ